MSKIFKNAAIVSPSYDGHANGVNFIALNEDGDSGQSVPFNIPHTLGSDDYAGTMSGGVTLSPLGGGDYSAIDTDVLNKSITIAKNTTSDDGTILAWEFTATFTSGSIIIDRYYNGTAILTLPKGEYTVVEGLNLIELPTRDGTASITLYTKNTAQTYNLALASNTVKQITNPNSYLTLQDKATEAHQTLGNSVDGGSSEELFPNGDFTDGNIDGWAGLSATVSYNISESLDIETLAAGGGIYHFDTIPGKTYTFSLECLSTDADYSVRVISNAEDELYFSGADIAIPNVFSSTFIATTNSARFYLRHGTSGLTNWDNISIKEILPISTKYNQDKSCANIFTTDVPVTDADRVICDADELAVFKLIKGDLTTGLSFGAINVKSLWLGNEGLVSPDNINAATTRNGEYIQDLLAPLGVEKINNYNFSTSDLSGWVNGRSTISVVSNALEITEVGTSNGYAEYAFAQFNIGIPVIVEIDVNYGKYTISSKRGGSVYNLSSVGSTDTGKLVYFTTFGIDTILLYSMYLIDGEKTSFNSVSTREATAVEIQAYTDTCRDYFKNLDTKGPNRLLLEEDATGRAIAVREDYSVNLKNPRGKSVGIGYKPNTPNYTIMEVSGGELAILDSSGNPTGGTSQREEFRVITHEDGVGDELRVNHVAQPTPTLPDPDVFMNVTGTANIGYQDTIDAAHAKIMVWTSIKTPAEQLAFINDVIAATRDVLTDENDVPLEDENGMYMYT